MQYSKEKAPKKGVRPSVALLVLAVIGAAAILSIGATMTPVFAAPPSGETPGHSEGHGTPRTEPGQQDDPECWGEATNQLTHLDDGQPGIGEHVSNPIPNNDDPHDTPRLGVGNQVEDTPAQHGETVGAIIGISCEDERDD
jgi:hypothetical protein